MILARNRQGLRRSRERGVTLIELMIAISLVAIISTGLLYATRSSLQVQEKIDHRLHANRERVNLGHILSRQIGGFVPVVNFCPAGEAGMVAVPFFLGAPDRLRLVSSFSIEGGSLGYPQILDYRILPDPKGGVRLVVNEYPFTGPASLQPFCLASAFPPAPANAIVVAERMQSGRFLYKGSPPGNFEPTGWIPLWSLPQTPGVIRIELAPSAGSDSIPILSVTVPLRTDREIFATYADRLQ